MSDLVERLRNHVVQPWMADHVKLCHEAADRIQELEGALMKIAHPPDDIDAPHYPVSVARAALKEKGNV